MILPPDDVIKARAEICATCDKTKDMSADPLYFFVDMAGKLIPDAPKTLCTECACPVWVKVRFMTNSCPLGKWEK